MFLDFDIPISSDVCSSSNLVLLRCVLLRVCCLNDVVTVFWFYLVVGATGTPTSSKRGYPAKKRNEAAQIVANGVQICPTDHIVTNHLILIDITFCSIPQPK